MVPEGWELIQLGELGTKHKPAVKAGPFGSALKKEFYVVKGYKIYGQEQVILNDDTHGDYYIDEEKYHSLISCAVEPGDILISLVGTVGRTLIITEASEPGIINPRLLRVSVNKEKVHDYFLKYFLEAEKTINTLLGWAQGGTMGVLNAGMIKRLNVPIPPLPEQKKIAQILSTWDQAITTTEQLLANSRQQKKALMQQLLTGKKRLLDKDGIRFSGEWEEGNLGDIAVIDSGFAFKSTDFTEQADGVPIVRMSDFKDGGLDITGAARVSRKTVEGLHKYKLSTGDFIFGMSGSLSNYGWVKEINLPCYLNQRVGRIVAKCGSNQLFVTYLYLSDRVQQSILDKAAGAAQLNISVSELRRTKVYFPSMEEQQKIAAVLSTADREIDTLQRKLEALKQEKKALMQQLLTGKRRVKTN